MSLPPELVSLVSTALVLSALCYIVRQCARVHKDTLANIGQYGSDNEAKRLSSAKSIFNFYIVVGIAFTTLSAYLKLFGSELFVGLFVSELIALGIKLTFDIRK